MLFSSDDVKLSYRGDTDNTLCNTSEVNDFSLELIGSLYGNDAAIDSTSIIVGSTLQMLAACWALKVYTDMISCLTVCLLGRSPGVKVKLDSELKTFKRLVHLKFSRYSRLALVYSGCFSCRCFEILVQKSSTKRICT